MNIPSGLRSIRPYRCNLWYSTLQLFRRLVFYQLMGLLIRRKTENTPRQKTVNHIVSNKQAGTRQDANLFGQKLRWEHSFKAYKLGPPHHFCEALVSFLILVSLTTTSLIVILWSGKSLEHRKPISNIGARKLLHELKEPCGSRSSTMSFKELFVSRQ